MSVGIIYSCEIACFKLFGVWCAHFRLRGFVVILMAQTRAQVLQTPGFSPRCSTSHDDASAICVASIIYTVIDDAENPSAYNG